MNSQIEIIKPPGICDFMATIHSMPLVSDFNRIKQPHDVDDLRSEILAKLRSGYKYRQLEDEYNHVNRYYLWHIAHTPGYYPPPTIAIRLGVRVYKLAPACPRCGAVHTTKRCTANAKPTPRRPVVVWRYCPACDEATIGEKRSGYWKCQVCNNNWRVK